MVEPQQQALAVEQDANRVEAKLAWTRPLRCLAEECRREAPHLAALAFVERVPWRRDALRSSRLDLNEDECRAIADD